MITVEGLRMVYPTKSGDIVALDGVDLHVPAGAVVGIVGESGAGKSTLVRCLTMLDRPTAGRIIVDGQELTGLGHRELRRSRSKLGMVFQAVNLLDSRTAVDNIAFPLELAGVPAAERRKRAEELLDLVGLAGRGGSYPSQLSGGQKQRVGIARALAADPAVLLCDEPTSALDPGTTNEILQLLADLRDRIGVTILIITHEMSVVKQACDHIARLAAGKIVEFGPLIKTVNEDAGLVRELLPQKVSAAHRGPVLDLTFTAEASGTDLTSKLARAFDTDISVLAATVEQVGDHLLGRIQLGLPESAAQDGTVEQIVDFLTDQQVQVRVVSS